VNRLMKEKNIIKRKGVSTDKYLQWLKGVDRYFIWLQYVMFVLIQPLADLERGW
jgi:hypothetical protein